MIFFTSGSSMAPWPAGALGPWPWPCAGAAGAGPPGRHPPASAARLAMRGQHHRRAQNAGNPGRRPLRRLAQRLHLPRPLARHGDGELHQPVAGGQALHQPGFHHVPAAHRVTDRQERLPHRLDQRLAHRLKSPLDPTISPEPGYAGRARFARPRVSVIWTGTAVASSPYRGAGTWRAKRRPRRTMRRVEAGSIHGAEQRRTQPVGQPPTGRALGVATADPARWRRPRTRTRTVWMT